MFCCMFSTLICQRLRKNEAKSVILNSMWAHYNVKLHFFGRPTPLMLISNGIALMLVTGGVKAFTNILFYDLATLTRYKEISLLIIAEHVGSIIPDSETPIAGGLCSGISG